ncbi:hypothetical protein Nepgr_002886 [Nepenthes gracilis]|uniref:Uncharacterized protein n=1 Tax=Nepenthes gracilis TaxID=150966 RepID=A0AAD3P7X4_NEPGR|nr:hypothetical protein Nepgr_002886 [Nepenthes gracilis]
MDRHPSLLLTDGALDVLELVASPNGDVSALASPVEIEVAYHGKPVHQVKGRDANMDFQRAVDKSEDKSANQNTVGRKQIRRGENLTPLFAEQDSSHTSLHSGVVVGGFQNQSDIGVHAGAEKALPEKLGSAVEHPLDQSVEHPSDAVSFKLLENNQWGIMPPADYAAETHQLSVSDHVAGHLDLKMNDKESPFPMNNLFSVLQDPVESCEHEDCVDPVGRIVMNTQPPPEATEISLLALACPEIEG